MKIDERRYVSVNEEKKLMEKSQEFYVSKMNSATSISNDGTVYHDEIRVENLFVLNSWLNG